MKNLIKSIALVGMFAMTTQAEENVQATEKSAAEQHQEAIAAQTQRWIEETRNGVPSKERMEEIIASNRRIIQEIWEKEAERQSNSRTQ